MLIVWLFDAKIEIEFEIRLIAQPYRPAKTVDWLGGPRKVFFFLL